MSGKSHRELMESHLRACWGCGTGLQGLRSRLQRVICPEHSVWGVYLRTEVWAKAALGSLRAKDQAVLHCSRVVAGPSVGRRLLWVQCSSSGVSCLEKELPRVALTPLVGLALSSVPQLSASRSSFPAYWPSSLSLSSPCWLILGKCVCLRLASYLLCS